MHLVGARLQLEIDDPVRFVQSPHVGGQLDPRFLIIHYTGGQTLRSTVEWMISPDSKASSHLIIGKDGDLVQLVPFDRQAFHTGPSAWRDNKGMAPFSIGIELDNPGPMVPKGQKWKATFGKGYPEAEVVRMDHKNGGPYHAWHTFPQAQIDTAVEVCLALAEALPIEEILGHDDISPGRKWDPGPAFPMDELREMVFGPSKAGKHRRKN
jgi:N-acetylmuramoyl-L-alanine amidase